MTDEADLERRYRTWLRWYPKDFRREHEAEIIGVLLAGARDGQRQPDLAECLDLMSGALRMRLRPRTPRSDRSAIRAVRLMYLGAVLELVAAITILATAGDVTASVVNRIPGPTEIGLSTVVAAQVVAIAAAAGIGVGFWLWMAWAFGRGHRWTRFVFATFFGLNTLGLLQGLTQGSAVYAQADLAIGCLLWLFELAAFGLMFHKDLGWHSRRNGAGSRSGQG